MPKYTVDAAFWHKGELLAVGASVTMTESEAKYRKHAITEVGGKAAEPGETPAVETVATAPAQALGATVEEKPAATGLGKRRRNADSHNADAAN
jgi:hypothetical protein